MNGWFCYIPSEAREPYSYHPMQVEKESPPNARETYESFLFVPFVSIRGPKVFVAIVIPHMRSGFQEGPGGVFLTIITTSHSPFAMNSRIAGKKYVLTGT